MNMLTIGNIMEKAAAALLSQIESISAEFAKKRKCCAWSGR